jgi:hypothetical protein
MLRPATNLPHQSSCAIFSQTWRYVFQTLYRFNGQAKPLLIQLAREKAFGLWSNNLSSICFA